MIVLEEKRCGTCKQVKSLSDFYRNKSNKDGLQGYCKPCQKACQKRTENPQLKRERRRAWFLKKLYDLSVEEYEALLVKQDGRCAICKVEECATGRKLAVDHDHKTGQVRGLLCFDCNQALGHLKDSPESLRAALAYLKQA